MGVPASCPGAWVLEVGGRERKATWLHGTARVQLCSLIPRSEWINRLRLLLLFFHYPQAAFPVGLSGGSAWLWCAGTLSHPGLHAPVLQGVPPTPLVVSLPRPLTLLWPVRPRLEQARQCPLLRDGGSITRGPTAILSSPGLLPLGREMAPPLCTGPWEDHSTAVMYCRKRTHSPCDTNQGERKWTQASSCPELRGTVAPAAAGCDHMCGLCAREAL